MYGFYDVKCNPLKKLPLEKLPELAAEMREALFHRITPEFICEDVAAKCLR